MTFTHECDWDSTATLSSTCPNGTDITTVCNGIAGVRPRPGISGRRISSVELCITANMVTLHKSVNSRIQVRSGRDRTELGSLVLFATRCEAPTILPYSFVFDVGVIHVAHRLTHVRTSDQIPISYVSMFVVICGLLLLFFNFVDERLAKGSFCAHATPARRYRIDGDVFGRQTRVVVQVLDLL